MSQGYRFKREVAEQVAQRLTGLLEASCEQIAVAGSLRRGKASVGDIELVAVPKVKEIAVAGQMGLFGEGTAASVKQVSELDAMLEQMEAGGQIAREQPYTREKGVWGPRRKQFWAPLQMTEGVIYITVDLYIVTPPAQWGSIFTIRTGPGDFNKALMRHIIQTTRWRQEDGRLICREAGIEAKTPTEKAYFDTIRVPWIKPEERSAEKLRQVLAGAPLPITRVVNIRDLPPGWKDASQYVYIGRAHYPKRLGGSKWGNPFEIGREGNRQQVIEKYGQHLKASPWLQQEIPQLVGKTLVCWCKPEACHGDILALLANRYTRGIWSPSSRQGAMGHNDIEARRAIRARLEKRAGIRA